MKYRWEKKYNEKERETLWICENMLIWQYDGASTFRTEDGEYETLAAAKKAQIRWYES
jgi:hypothetical protein